VTQHVWAFRPADMEQRKIADIYRNAIIIKSERYCKEEETVKRGIQFSQTVMTKTSKNYYYHYYY